MARRAPRIQLSPSLPEIWQGASRSGGARRTALFLLFLVFVLFIWATAEAQQEPFPWLQAFSAAAMVGGLADWFAVAAIFRHPLGLPFPHTAILPRNRERLANRLSAFIRDHFLQSESIIAYLHRNPPSAAFGQWLAHPRNRHPLARQMNQFIQKALELADLEPLARLLRGVLAQQLQELDLSRGFEKILLLLVENGRHQEILDDGIDRLQSWLDQECTQDILTVQIEQILQRAYPMLFSWLGAVVDPASLSRNLSRNLVRATHQMLQEISEDPEDPRRLALENWFVGILGQLHHDSGFRLALHQWQSDLLEHPATREYLQSISGELRQWLLEDLSRPDSRLQRLLQRAARHLGRLLAGQPEFSHIFDGYVEDSIRQLFPSFRKSLTRHIADTIRAWPMDDLVRNLEEGIGEDLQYIRINGTLVGGCLGLAIHAMSQLLTLFSGH